MIDLPGQRQNLSLKTTQSKTIEKVEQMLFDLEKIKSEQNTTSTSTAHAISKKREDVVFFEDSDSNSSSYAPNSKKSKHFDKLVL